MGRTPMGHPLGTLGDRRENKKRSCWRQSEKLCCDVFCWRPKSVVVICELWGWRGECLLVCCLRFTGACEKESNAHRSIFFQHKLGQPTQATLKTIVVLRLALGVQTGSLQEPGGTYIYMSRHSFDQMYCLPISVAIGPNIRSILGSYPFS